MFPIDSGIRLVEAWFFGLAPTTLMAVIVHLSMRVDHSPPSWSAGRWFQCRVAMFMGLFWTVLSWVFSYDSVATLFPLNSISGNVAPGIGLGNILAYMLGIWTPLLTLLLWPQSAPEVAEHQDDYRDKEAR